MDVGVIGFCWMGVLAATTFRNGDDDAVMPITELTTIADGGVPCNGNPISS